MRSATLVIIIFLITILTIELYAVSELYKKFKYQDKNQNLTNKVKRDVEVLDVDKLRFEFYIRDFNKTYNKEEYRRRFNNFKASLKDIARLNRLENNTVFGLTKFSDMTKEEFADRMLLKSLNIAPCQHLEMTCSDTLEHNTTHKKIYGEVPVFLERSFDWRNHPGVVKPVLDQKLCQGCWAFSIVGVLESMSAIKLKDFRSRSIEELLDCSPFTNGCYNGSVSKAMRYICNNKTEFVTEEEYPLTLPIDVHKCKLPPPEQRHSVRMVKQFVHNCKMNEIDMLKAIVSHGPLVAAVDSSNWRNYIGGVITRACTRGVSNHVVQIVGYEGYGGPDAKIPIPYYIVRNSFGEDWGDHGYVKIAMKHGDIADVCGIAEQVTIMDVL